MKNLLKNLSLVALMVPNPAFSFAHCGCDACECVECDCSEDCNEHCD